MRIGFAIARASALTPTWTTVHLAAAALARGHHVVFIEPWDFEVSGGALRARCHEFAPGEVPRHDNEELVDRMQRRRARRSLTDVGSLDMLLLRCSRVTEAVLAFASMAQAMGVRVVNPPAALVACGHKAWLAGVAGAAVPPTLVTRNRGAAHVFYEELEGEVVVKPAQSSGGRRVTLVRQYCPDRLDAAFDLASQVNDGYVVVQGHAPGGEAGEKRLVWLDGKILGGYLRRRAPGEFRHNLKQGGLAEAVDITDEDRAVAQTVSPALIGLGVRLAGLDVIGNSLIEVNTRNPGGAYHVDRLTGSRLADTIISRLEQPTIEADSWDPPVR